MVFQQPNNPDRMTLIHPAPDANYEWRVTRFDADGFCGHSCAHSKGDAVKLARDYGYTQPATQQQAEEVMDTDRFIRGSLANWWN